MGNKDRLKKSLNDLSEKAADCSELAKTHRNEADKQRASSDKLHDDARRLEVLGDGLKEDVADLKAELETSISPLSSKGV